MAAADHVDALPMRVITSAWARLRPAAPPLLVLVLGLLAIGAIGPREAATPLTA